MSDEMVICDRYLRPHAKSHGHAAGLACINPRAADSSAPALRTQGEVAIRERLKHLSFVITGNDYAFFHATGSEVDAALKAYNERVLEDHTESAASAPALRTQGASREVKCANCGDCNGNHRAWCDMDNRAEMIAALQTDLRAAESRLFTVREYVERELRKPVQLAADLKFLTDIQEIVKGPAT